MIRPVLTKDQEAALYAQAARVASQIDEGRGLDLAYATGQIAGILFEAAKAYKGLGIQEAAEAEALARKPLEDQLAAALANQPPAPWIIDGVTVDIPVQFQVPAYDPPAILKVTQKDGDVIVGREAWSAAVDVLGELLGVAMVDPIPMVIRRMERDLTGKDPQAYVDLKKAAVIRVRLIVERYDVIDRSGCVKED